MLVFENNPRNINSNAYDTLEIDGFLRAPIVQKCDRLYPCGLSQASMRDTTVGYYLTAMFGKEFPRLICQVWKPSVGTLSEDWRSPPSSCSSKTFLIPA